MKKLYTDSGRSSKEEITRIRVVDEKGKDLLSPNSQMAAYYNGHMVWVLGKNYTNNDGELFAVYQALQIANKNGIKTICTDSEVVGKWWVYGYGKELKNKIKNDSFANFWKKFQKEFIAFKGKGGKVVIISGGDNPADLGDHK